jgi:hypothetical protein
MTAPSPHVGSILRDYRMDKGLTEKEVYAPLGLSPSWLYSFERRGRCYERNLRKIFETFPDVKRRALEAMA